MNFSFRMTQMLLFEHCSFLFSLAEVECWIVGFDISTPSHRIIFLNLWNEPCSTNFSVHFWLFVDSVIPTSEDLDIICGKTWEIIWRQSSVFWTSLDWALQKIDFRKSEDFEFHSSKWIYQINIFPNSESFRFKWKNEKPILKKSKQFKHIRTHALV